MFEPEILGWPSSSWASLAQALLTPALGFLFLYLMRLPLTKLAWVPDDAKYRPPRWVLPLFAQGSVFAIVAAFSAYLFASYLNEPDLSPEIKSELFQTRDLASADPLSDVTVSLNAYDGFSHFRVFVNGYDVFSTTRDCVATFQCKPKGDEKATAEAIAFKSRVTGRGSAYDLARSNPLGEEISLRHYLVTGQNHVDLVSENSGTGGCELTAEFALKVAQQQPKRHVIRIFGHEGPEPPRAGALMADEHFYSRGTFSEEDLVGRYKTSKYERRGVVCERIRVVLTLTEPQATALSAYRDFASHFKALQMDYVCATIGSAIDQCGLGP